MSVSFPFLQVAFDRFVPPGLLDFVRRWKIDLNEVESLKRTSAMIQDLFDEAEVKQLTSVAVKSWLDHLKQILYDAEDILDEYATELLRLKLESDLESETDPHQTQQGIKRLESKGRDINEGLKKLKLDSEYHINPHQTQQVRSPVPVTPSESSVSSLSKFGIECAVKGINERLGSKVRDINERLKSIAQEGVALGLNSSMGSGTSRPKVFSQRPQTSSLVIRSKVFGREEDKGKIVKWLLSDKTPSPSNSDNNFSVLPIVGMGGAGKTTLAQLIYNHETVENSKYFDLKAWVCVSDDFDVLRLTKEILESITRSSEPSNSLDVLQMKLKEALSRKRFLLVLDDMWNNNYERWDALSTAFAFGKPGSKILVTTRNKSVSSMVRTVLNDHDLKVLSDEDCFAMFRRHAFMDENSFDAKQKLEVFGQEIVKNCKGLPLAIKTLAGLLRGKTENSEWEDILENEIWDLRESEILPSLMLSYHHLPPLLKRCFGYCALFPKDYVFDKIELVMLWMAEGIVQPIPKGKKRLEDIGAGYFDELFMRSFFELSNRSSPLQASPFVKPRSYYTIEEFFYDLANKFHMRSFFESSSNTRSGFVMHDLIHDLAQFVSSGIYCRREGYDNNSSEVLTTTRHLSYLTNNFNVEATEYEVMKSVRTLLDLNYRRGFSDEQLLPTMQCQFQFLRVLRVRNFSNRELPDSIGKLKHLRLLDLSFSINIVRLPDSITSLYNLQMLLLTGCWSLRELPEDIGNLINLRHLFLPVDPRGSYKMRFMGVGNLTSLQTLSTFIVDSKTSSELRNLSQLRGSLDISNLENVGNINGTKALVANLNKKPHLLGLRLRWSDYKSEDCFGDLGRDEKVEEDVLLQLQPHTNLEALWIQHYGGTRFPSWIEHPSFSSLETVQLISCCKLRFLPHLSQLPLLKHLVIAGCGAIKIMGSELYGDCSSSSADKQFQSLETLRIEWMEEWEEWPQVVEEEGGGQFPCLCMLIIKECPKLRMFSHRFPSLVKLEIEKCNDLRELPWFLPSLRKLRITECPKVVVLPSLPSIEKLVLSRCYQITTLSDSGHLSSSSSSSFFSETSAPCAHNSFPCLHELIIRFCPNLRELPGIFPSLESLHISVNKELCFLPMLPSIKDLTLHNCKGMVLNNRTVPQLSSLSFLTIDDVSDLESLPNGFMQQLTTLQKLEIFRCTELTVLLQNEIGSDLLPSSLQHLHIRCCDNLRKLPQKGLHSLMSLQEIVVQSCPALVSFQEIELPTALHKLEIRNCKNLRSLPEGLHKLMSLQRLIIEECPALGSFPDMGLPTALRELSILKCRKLYFSPNELHELTNLQKLEIVKCYLMYSKNQKALFFFGLHNLTTLRSLAIGGCLALVSIPKGVLPTNLRDFYIKDCPILESLHDGLSNLTSLEHLCIRNCPMLTQRCQEKEGEEWSKIAQIPRVMIDGYWQ